MDDLMLERVNLALKASNEGLWLWNLRENEILFSPRTLNFLGMQSEQKENIFLNLDDYFHSEDVERVQRAIDRVMAEKNHDQYLAVEARVRRLDGGYLWLRIRASRVLDSDGKLLSLAGSMIDISRRKETERKLDDERFLLYQLIDNIPNNLYFKDKDSRFVMVNQATVDKMGVASLQQLIGKTDHDFFNKSHADFSRMEEIETMEQRAERKAKLVREIWNADEDSWGLSYKLPWLDSNGEVLGTFGVTSDVTEMVQVQQRLTKAADQLRDINATFHEQLELAKQVQQAALDASPASFPRGSSEVDLRVQFTPFYKPDSEMAGDFYEVFPISPEKAGVMICDVMGHGVKAALAVAMIRGMIDKDPSVASLPDAFLRGLNEHLVDIFGHAGIQMFATACYMVIDLKEQELHLASAGHPMPFIVQDKTISQLEAPTPARGPALGMIPGAAYQFTTIPLHGMQQILLYTDGIYEVENPVGEELGVTGLLDGLNKRNLFTGAATVDSVIEVAESYAGSSDFGDDVCLLAIDVKR